MGGGIGNVDLHDGISQEIEVWQCKVQILAPLIKMTKIDHIEFSRKGGKATLAKYGSNHFSELGQKGSKTRLAKYDKEYFLKISKMGIEARKRKKQLSKRTVLERAADLLTGKNE